MSPWAQQSERSWALLVRWSAISSNCPQPGHRS